MVQTNQDIQVLITNSNLLPNEKQYLLERLEQMDMLERFKLKHSLQTGQYPDALKSFHLLRENFVNLETKNLDQEKKDFLQQLKDLIGGHKSGKKIVSYSILTQPALLGTPIPKPIQDDTVKPLSKLTDFYHPVQLGYLDASHITIGLTEQNKTQVLNNFFEKLEQIFSKISDIAWRRGYFMNYLQSPLFSSYLNTGLTVLRHPELQPPQAALNLLSQLDSSYLNRHQFIDAANITNYIRNLCNL